MVGRIAKMRVRMGGESKSARGFLFSQIKDNCQFCGVLFDEPNLLYSIGLLLGSRAKAYFFKIGFSAKKAGNFQVN